MEDRVTLDRCPYCGVRQVGLPPTDSYYRCHGCNLFIRADWLVDDPEQYVLNDDRNVLCPWCGYPAGIEQPVTAEEEFSCEGCSGTLVRDTLVPQFALVVDRHRGRRERHLILIILVILTLAFLVVSGVFSR